LLSAVPILLFSKALKLVAQRALVVSTHLAVSPSLSAGMTIILPIRTQKATGLWVCSHLMTEQGALALTRVDQTKCFATASGWDQAISYGSAAQERICPRVSSETQIKLS